MRKALIAIIGFTVPLGLGEVYLQTADPYHFAEKEDWSQYAEKVLDLSNGRLQKGVTAHYLGKPTRISAQGWRSPEFEPEKPPGVFRILMLGGSIPYGWGVADGEEFPRLVEKDLNRRKFRGDRRIEVINTGVPGWKLTETGTLLMEQGFSWTPDMVMLLLVSTDVPREAKTGLAKPPRRSFFLPESWRRLRLLRAIENRYVFDAPGSQGRPYDSYENLPTRGLQLVANSLAMFRAACGAKGAEFVVIDTLNADITRAACKKHGIQRIEAYTPWALRRSWEVSVTDAHANAEGHRYYANLIVDGVK